MAVKKEIVLFWFKRDLRLEDNPALADALKQPFPSLLLYVYEPEIWKDPHYDKRHLRFIQESLTDLNAKLEQFNSKILCVTSDIITCFEGLQEIFTVNTIFSTQETGLDITFQRDIEVAKYLSKNKVVWKEYQNNGVVRGIKNRESWRKGWYEFMNRKIQPLVLNENRLLDLADIEGLESRFTPFPLNVDKHDFQKGGRSEAMQWMDSFFNERIAFYSQYISKPEMARYGCSRLSPYFAWGNISIREVYQRAKSFKLNSQYKRQTNAFMSRLRWQSHFIQKFEQEPRMEFEAINKGFLNLEQPLNESYVSAWIKGQTGYPLVDASMRCVAKNGYINFRMRSMVTSFLTHHLFQHFTSGGARLARKFLDFEPGIHYGQMQMQAGLTGTNTVRVYNPVKNALEHDSEAVFIKKYVPELAELPVSLAIEPWKISTMEEELYTFKYGKDYPLRIVDIKETRKEALQKLYGQRKSDLARNEKERILETHTIRRKVK